MHLAFSVHFRGLHVQWWDRSNQYFPSESPRETLPNNCLQFDELHTRDPHHYFLFVDKSTRILPLTNSSYPTQYLWIWIALVSCWTAYNRDTIIQQTKYPKRQYACCWMGWDLAWTFLWGLSYKQQHDVLIQLSQPQGISYKPHIIYSSDIK